MDKMAGMVFLLALTTAGAAAGQDPAATSPYKTAVRMQKETRGPLVVDFPSSFAHCVSSDDTRVHNLGFLIADAEVRIAFQSDFDPIAAVVGMRLGADAPDTALDRAEAQIFTDDDTGGELEPLIDFIAPFDGSYSLHVADGALELPLAGGCYVYELTLTLPLEEAETP